MRVTAAEARAITFIKDKGLSELAGVYRITLRNLSSSACRAECGMVRVISAVAELDRQF